MKVFLILLLLLLNFNIFTQSAIIVDDCTKEPLVFATFQSSDENCFGYSDRNGIINCNKCDINSQIIIRYLGYKSIKLKLNSLKVIDTIFMRKSQYILNKVQIIAVKINVQKELNSILKKIRKTKRLRTVNTYFYLESFEEDSLREKIKLIGADVLSNLKFINDNRVVGSFLIKKEKPYYSLDIDKFIKNIPYFSRKKIMFNHLFSKKKIDINDYRLKLIGSTSGNRLIKYTGKYGKIHGFVKYNPTTQEIIEHEYTTKENLENIFESLNKSNITIVDSINIHYFFNNNALDLVLFKIWIKKRSKKRIYKIITSGYLKIIDSQRVIDKIEIPKLKYNSLQEELIYSSPMNYLEKKINYLFKVDSLYSKNSSNNDYLYSADKLTKNLLSFFDNTNKKRKIWSKNKRLTIDDFVFKQPIQDYNNSSIKFLSDLQKIKINWIIIENREGNKVNYYSQKSILNNSEILYYGIRQAELIANISFDIYEIYRKKLIIELNRKQIYNSKQIINEAYSKATEMVNEFIQKTNYARNLNKLKKYNDFIIKNLGIDNLKISLSKVYRNNKELNSFSDGDMLAFFGKYNDAIKIYLNYLYKPNLDKKIKINILLNLCVIYKKIGNKEKLCKYYNILLDLDSSYKNSKFRFDCLLVK